MKHIPEYKIKKDIKLDEEQQKEYEKIKEKIIQQNLNNQDIQQDIKKVEIEIKKHTNNTQIISKLLKDINNYGKLDELLKDDELEEVMIIGDMKPVYVYHRQHGMMQTNIKLTSNETREIIEKIANNVQRKIDIQTPIVDARLDDGSRINATIPPISVDGPTLTIRKFRKNPYTIVDLIKSNTINIHFAAFMWLAIEGMGVKSSNIIIAGGTGSGKTTTLNTLTTFIPPYERIITIEDTLEMQIPHNHIIRNETRPPNIENKGEITMDLLLKNSLRQRPDRIIVGEVRTNEAITLFEALNTGHSGMGTVHANSAHETITRLINPPMNVPPIMIKSINYIIMQNRLYNPKLGTIRRISEVAEVVGMEDEHIQLNKIFTYDPSCDMLRYVAINSITLNEIAKLKNITNHKINEEIEKRKQYIQSYIDKYPGTSDIEHLQRYINNYYFS